jgi:hypothetical protein
MATAQLTPPAVPSPRPPSTPPPGAPSIMPPAPPPAVNGQPVESASSQLEHGPPPPPLSKNGQPVDSVEESPWMMCQAPDGRPYWYNTITKESSWNEPQFPSLAAEPVEDIDALPEGWTEEKDPQGRTYYSNLHTREASWTRPTKQRAGVPPPRPPPNPPPEEQGGGAQLAGGAARSKSESHGSGTGGGGSAVGEDGQAVAKEALALMNGMLKELKLIYHEASAAELSDDANGKHGAAQAQSCVDAAERMVAQWKARLQ